MNYCITPGPRSGTLSVPSSKSMLHRLLIAAALSQEPCSLTYSGLSRDVLATVSCLRALGSSIDAEEARLMTRPLSRSADAFCELNCGESGSTLRFLVPVAGALGRTAAFTMAEGLSRRPKDALLSVLEAHGVHFEKVGGKLISRGQLSPGAYEITGSISSQYISGLLFALPLLRETSTLDIVGSIESYPYIQMTEQVLRLAGIRLMKKRNRYTVPGNQKYALRGSIPVEADWSNAAFFLCMGALSEKGITLQNMPLISRQGDREILPLLRRFGAEVSVTEDRITVKKGRLTGQTVDAAPIPDLIPTISALAAFAEGTTRIVNAGRLRLKESDRLETTRALLQALGADIQTVGDGLVIRGRPALSGGTVHAANDHRIAMAAAVAACGCRKEVCVTGAECVEKSYPDFWKHFEMLEDNV